MILPPIAAWIGTSNSCRGMSPASSLHQDLAAGVGLVAVDDHRQRVHRVAVPAARRASPAGLAVADELVVERGVAAGAALQLVVEVEHDLGERQRRRRSAGGPRWAPSSTKTPRRSWQSPITAPMPSCGTRIVARTNGSSMMSMLVGGGSSRRRVARRGPRRSCRVHPVLDVRGRSPAARGRTRARGARCTISMCSRPRNPQRKPKPSACDVSGSSAQRGVVEATASRARRAGRGSRRRRPGRGRRRPSA